MAPPNDYRKPKNKELRDLTWSLPFPLRVKDLGGKILWRNRAAEACQGETGWSNLPITWQNKKAVLEMPDQGADSETKVLIEELQSENERLKKQQRHTARKKRQAEAHFKKMEKVAGSVDKLEHKFQEKLSAAEKEADLLRRELAEVRASQDVSGSAEAMEELSALRAARAKLESDLAKKTKALTTAEESQAEAVLARKELRSQFSEQEEALLAIQADFENSKLQLKEAQAEFEAFRMQVEEEDAQRKLEEQLAAKIQEFESLEKTFEDEQRAFDEQKKELQEKLSAQEQEFLKLKEGVATGKSAENVAPDIDVNELQEELFDTKADLQLAQRREKRLAEKLETLEELRGEHAQVLELLKEDLKEARQREKELKKTLELYTDVRKDSQATRAESRELLKRIADFESLEKSLREQLEKAKATAESGRVNEGSPVSDSGEDVSLSVKNQIEFLQKRLGSTEKELDRARVELKEEKAQNQASKEAERLAFQDSLTGLPNINMVDRYLKYAHQQAVSNGRVIALFLIDLDGFRVLNGTYGRDWGDSVLKAVGERLNGMRGSSHLVARDSQDRFMLLGAEIEKSAASKFVQEASQSLLEALAYPFEVNGETVKLTGSIGVSLGPLSGDSSGALYGQALTALDAAKEKGGSKFVLFDDRIKNFTQQETVYSKQMAHAIEKDEFSAVFQPVFHLGKGIVLGLELLLRWQHRDQRVLLPADFLDAAIKSGLIFRITEKLWPRAFRDFAKWRKMRPGLTLSINLCDKELLSPTLLKNALGWAKQAGVEPGSIVFEVRDGSRLRLSSSWWRILQEYTQAGFGLCLDDFGADESLFGTLAYGGFSQAKMAVDSRAPRLVTAPQATKGVLYCAKGLQAKFDPKALAKAGFNLAQGFAVSRPLDSADVDMLFN